MSNCDASVNNSKFSCNCISLRMHEKKHDDEENCSDVSKGTFRYEKSDDLNLDAKILEMHETDEIASVLFSRVLNEEVRTMNVDEETSTSFSHSDERAQLSLITYASVCSQVKNLCIDKDAFEYKISVDMSENHFGDEKDETKSLYSNKEHEKGLDTTAAETTDTVNSNDLGSRDILTDVWINDVLISLEKACKKDDKEDLAGQLYILWQHSVDLEVKIYLLKCNILSLVRRVIKKCSNKKVVAIAVDIAISACYTYEAINDIGNDEELAVKILNRLKSNNALVLSRLAIFLQSVVWGVMQEHKGAWTKHLKKCKHFGSCITSILSESSDSKLLIEVLALLQSLNEVSLPGDNLLEQMFNNELIPALFASFTQLIPIKKETFSTEELGYISNWLIVFSDIMQSSLFHFNKNEKDRSLSKLTQIMYDVLIPYKYFNNMFPMQYHESRMIGEIVHIMYQLHSSYNVQLKIDRILATIIANLNKNIELNLKSDSTLNANNEGLILLNYLCEYWLFVTKMNTETYIAEVLRVCDPADFPYLIDLTDPEKSCQVAQKLMELVTSLQPN